jgi:hypothetical protein
MDILRRMRDRRLVLLIISNDQPAVDVRGFLDAHIRPLPNLYQLFLIFPNGLHYHDGWTHVMSPYLHWCRSFTDNIITDSLEVCRSACDANISYFDQRAIEAEDQVNRQTNDGARSIVEFFSSRKHDFIVLLGAYVNRLLG